MMSLVTLFKRQVIREYLLHMRELRLCVNACLFFLMIIFFFPLTMPPNTELLRTIAPGFVWIAILFALFLSSERLFQQDYDDGVTEQWLISGYPVSLLVFVKMLVHWFINVIPMVILCPIIAVLLKLSIYETLILMISLICGTPTITALCTMAVAFSTGLKQKGVIMGLIVFPLTIPVMILGSSAATAVMQGLTANSYIALLLSLSLFTMSLLPFAIAGVLKFGLID